MLKRNRTCVRHRQSNKFSISMQQYQGCNYKCDMPPLILHLYQCTLIFYISTCKCQCFSSPLLMLLYCSNRMFSNIRTNTNKKINIKLYTLPDVIEHDAWKMFYTQFALIGYYCKCSKLVFIPGNARILNMYIGSFSSQERGKYYRIRIAGLL